MTAVRIEAELPEISIESDGTPGNTRVLVDGKPLPYVVDVRWEIGAGRNAIAVVRLHHTAIKALVKTEVPE